MIFSIILWPPARPFFDEIQELIVSSFLVVEKFDLIIDKKVLKKLMDYCYKPDRTPAKRILSKYKAISKYKLEVRTFNIEILNPTMVPHRKSRLKGTFFCREIKRFKKRIREKYMKRISGYVYDIIIHITDNESRTDHIQKFLNKVKNVDTLF